MEHYHFLSTLTQVSMLDLLNGQPHQSSRFSHVESQLRETDTIRTEETIVEKKTSFRDGPSTKDSNFRIMCGKHTQYQQDLCHVFIGIQKAFGSVWEQLRESSVGN